MKRRGLFWVGLGMTLCLAATLVGHSEVYWWDLPLYLLGVISVMAGVIRMDESGQTGRGSE